MAKKKIPDEPPDWVTRVEPEQERPTRVKSTGGVKRKRKKRISLAKAIQLAEQAGMEHWLRDWQSGGKVQ